LGDTENALEVSRLLCEPATLAKGLEFDAVVVAEPARIAAAEPRAIQRRYVALTAPSAARTSGPLPAALVTSHAVPEHRDPARPADPQGDHRRDGPVSQAAVRSGEL
jgi:hypothetical protein